MIGRFERQSLFCNHRDSMDRPGNWPRSLTATSGVFVARHHRRTRSDHGCLGLSIRWLLDLRDGGLDQVFEVLLARIQSPFQSHHTVAVYLCCLSALDPVGKASVTHHTLGSCLSEKHPHSYLDRRTSVFPFLNRLHTRLQDHCVVQQDPYSEVKTSPDRYLSLLRTGFCGWIRNQPLRHNQRNNDVLDRKHCSLHIQKPQSLAPASTWLSQTSRKTC